MLQDIATKQAIDRIPLNLVFDRYKPAFISFNKLIHFEH